jgi:hypothetical protein
MKLQLYVYIYIYIYGLNYSNKDALLNFFYPFLKYIWELGVNFDSFLLGYVFQILFIVMYFQESYCLFVKSSYRTERQVVRPVHHVQNHT